MNSALESIKAGLLQAIAYQKKISHEVNAHTLAPTLDNTARHNVKRVVTPAVSIKR